MERKNFLKYSFSAMGLATVMPLVKACTKNGAGQSSTSSGASGSVSNVTPDTDCTVTPTEEEGPFPTHTPSAYVRSDITKGDGVGAALVANITIVDAANKCAALQGVMVDVWQCDVGGNYSEYGGSGMQSTDFQNVHWLRGRQVTDANGLVTFKTIFPGWYQGRATHIHAHIFNASGTSLLVTQIAFPDALCTTVNTDGSSYGYTKGLNGYTYNNADHVFSDSLAEEIATITGSMADGFSLSTTIRVNV